MSELRDVLQKHGFRFKKQFGQNFISDTNLLRSIVEASGIDKNTTVVEIGCGAGTRYISRILRDSRFNQNHIKHLCHLYRVSFFIHV